MKLHHSPARCPHIALLGAGLPCELVEVDIRAKKLENGEDYLKLNPKGPGPCAGPRQRRDRDRRPGDCPDDRRSGGQGAGAGRGDLMGNLSGMPNLAAYRARVAARLRHGPRRAAINFTSIVEVNNNSPLYSPGTSSSL